MQKAIVTVNPIIFEQDYIDYQYFKRLISKDMLDKPLEVVLFPNGGFRIVGQATNPLNNAHLKNYLLDRIACVFFKKKEYTIIMSKPYEENQEK